MAAAVPVTAEPWCATHWRVAGPGRFAAEIGAALDVLGVPVRRRPERRVDPATSFDGPGGVIHALEVRDPEALDGTDIVAFTRRRPWLPVVLEPEMVQVGPLIVPGTTACHLCTIRRRVQHATNQTVLTRILTSPSTGRAGPGWLPWHVEMAAAVTATVLRDPGRECGHVWSIHLGTLETSRAHVAAVHGCRRCGSRESSPSVPDELSGFVGAMRPRSA